MDRTQFFHTDTVNGVPEFDYLYNSLANFQMTYPVSYYMVNDSDLLRPDMISYKVYNGSVEYWWIICFINKIQNPLVDLVTGDTLTIPNFLDIINFYRKYKVNN